LKHLSLKSAIAKTFWVWVFLGIIAFLEKCNLNSFSAQQFFLYVEIISNLSKFLLF